MVRETRHLWIGNLPENVREDDVRDLFQRHGRVQSVKLLDDSSTASGRNGKCATVAFIDIRSASKALRSVRTVAGQPIHISYHEPGSTPSQSPSIPPLGLRGETPLNSDSPIASASSNASSNPPVINSGGNTNNCIPSTPGLYRQRFGGQHGQSEEPSSHFYEQPKSFSRGRGDSHGFHGRGRRDNRPPFHNNNRHSFGDNRHYRGQWNYHQEGRFAPPVHSEIDDRNSSQLSNTNNHPPSNDCVAKPPRRAESPANSVSSRHVISKRRRSRSVSDSGSSERGSSAGSRSRSGSRSSVSTSVSSSRSRSPSNHSHFNRGAGSSGDRLHHNSRPRHRYSRSRVLSRASEPRIRHNSRSPLAASPSSSNSSSPSPHRKITAPHSPSHSPSSTKSYSPSRNAGGSQHHGNHLHHRRAPTNTDLQAAIKIRNLPIRSSDTSLKDGLYHEYKKHGKVAWVRISGTGQERFAIVCFKSAEHATKAVSVSQGKLFFGCKIQVTPYFHAKGEEVLGGQDEENRLAGDDEPTSVGYPTRTILITGLDASVTTSDLRSAFDQYGDIVRLDIRKQGTAVCEFVDIASAIRAQWGRHVFKGKEARILFYRSPPTNALVLDGAAGLTEKQVYSQCSQYGAIKQVVMDSERILSLVHYQEVSEAQTAIRQLRNWAIKGKRLQVDFASNEVIKKIMIRVGERGPTSVGSCSPGLISSPSIGNSTTPLQDTMNVDRKSDRQVKSTDSEDVYRASSIEQPFHRAVTTNLQPSMDDYDPSLVDSAVVSSQKAKYNTIQTCTSPVSPDGDPILVDKQSKSPKCSSTTRLDLDCHEVDSAIVTSSSDILVGDKNEFNSNSGHSSDEKAGCEDSDVELRNSLDSCAAITFLDGVSSTSPEPKSETVRKASPDSANSFHRKPVNRTGYKGGVVDPRRLSVNAKIRRSSADSGNSTTMCSRMHSTTQSSSLASVTAVCDDESSKHCDEVQNRPGTPLFDENPDCFEDTEKAKSSCSAKSNPIFLPLPGFGQDLHHHRQRTESSASFKELPTSSLRTGRTSAGSDGKSPSKSPVVSTACRNECSVLTDFEDLCDDTSSPLSWKDDYTKKMISNSECKSASATDSKPTSDIDRLKHESEEDPVSSPELEISGSSPASPVSESLHQRVLKVCEKYDRVNGSKLALESSISFDAVHDVPQVQAKPVPLSDSDQSNSRVKFLGWSELIHKPSDIGKSVLARRSVFDEDSKRLENFGDKYEGKGAVVATCNNWRTIALQRSFSFAGFNSTNTGWKPGQAGHSPNSLHATSIPSPSLPSRSNNPQPAQPSTLLSKIPSSHPMNPMKPSDNSSPAPALKPVLLNRTQPQPSPMLPSFVQKGPTMSKPSVDMPSKSSVDVIQSELKPVVSSITSVSPDQSNRASVIDIPTTPVLERSLVEEPNKKLQQPQNRIGNDSIISSSVPQADGRVTSQNPPNTERKAPTLVVQDRVQEMNSLRAATDKPVVLEDTKFEKHPAHPVEPPKKDDKNRLELDLTKKDITSFRAFPPETPTAVAVVATDSVLLGRTESAGPANNKDSSRKDKDKKRRNSGTSTPAPPHSLANVFGFPTPRSSENSDPSSSNLEVSSKHGQEKKDKKHKEKVKESKPDSSNPSENPENTKDDSARKTDRDINKKDKEIKKERKESHKDPAGVPSQSESSRHPADTHHRREKEKEGHKRKREDSESVNDGDRDVRESDAKKVKIEKELVESVHNRVKAVSSSERRDSRDSSSSGKERTKESVRTTVELTKDKTRDESKHKDGHRSKDKSSSHGRDKDKHEKSRTGSESRSSKSEVPSKDKVDKDKSKKEGRAPSPGKENSKGLSRHHSHSGSHKSSGSVSSSKKPKEGSSSSSKSHHTQESTKKSVQKHHTSESDDGTTDKAEHKTKSSKSHSKSKSDKRDPEKRDRRRSGGGKENDSERKKHQELKKKKFVVEETESSTDDEEKKKHHSIFDVVVDEYVSMYDKVKARSNRACKAQPSQQQIDEMKKQDKIKDQFRQLKQSRAKKIEQKRSTSVDEGEGHKSELQTSSDDDDSLTISSSHKHSTDVVEKQHRSMELSSENEDEAQKLSKKLKNKRRNSGDKAHRKKGKKSMKSPTHKSMQRSISAVFSPSESDSNSSSVSAEPQLKRKKLEIESSKTATKTMSRVYKSSEESLSDSDDSDIQKSSRKTQSTQPHSKLQATEIYSSDSDSSVASGRKLPVLDHSDRSKTKDKLSRQKSMKKALFESSESSDEDTSKPVVDIRKDKPKSSLSSSSHRVKTKEESNKSHKKKHHRDRVHSNKSSKSKKREGSGDLLPEPQTIKKEPTSNMKDILFGPMSASSDSEDDDHSSRPKTPVFQPEISKKPDKSKSRSASPACSSETSPNNVVVEKLKSSGEKKRKKSHKEKRSRKGSDDHHKSKSNSTIDSKPDFDALFNSPRASPCKDYITPPQPPPHVKQDNLPNPTPSFNVVRALSVSPTKQMLDKSAESSREISKSMFSSDEDDDDAKLKIDINEAIIASSDEPGLEASDGTDKLKREEEEKQKNLFEQDKAIESIVLLDRTSPLRTCPLQDEEALKDELPKNCTAISQEETEDAVAALLETLEEDAMEDSVAPAKVVVAATTTAPPIPSPPTLRIIEENTTENAGPNSGSSDSQQQSTPSVIAGWPFMNDSKPTEKGIAKPAESPCRKLSTDSSGVENSSAVQVRRGSGSCQSRRSSADREVEGEVASGDVYEFHESDDEKSSGKHFNRPEAAPQKPSPPVSVDTTAKSPVPSIPEPPTASEVIKIPTVTAPTVTVPVVSPIILPETSAQLISLPTVSPTLSSRPTPFTPITPVSADPFAVMPKPVVTTQASPPTLPTLPRPTVPTTTRTHVDDTIEDVIRMAVEGKEDFAISKPAPPKPATARGRSRSKDSVSEDAASTPRTLSRPSATTPSIAEVPVVKTEAEPRDEGPGLETLIDPQTGILMPMLRQSDEGQYVPIIGQDSSGPPRPHFASLVFQPKAETEVSRSLAEDRAAQHGLKHEGLVATMISHPQSFQVSNANQFSLPSPTIAVSTSRMNCPPTKFLSSSPAQRQTPPGAAAFIANKAPQYYGVPTTQQQTKVYSAGSSPARSTHTPEFSPLLQRTSSHESIPVSISHLGPGPIIRFPVTSSTSHLVESGYQYVISKAIDSPGIVQACIRPVSQNQQHNTPQTPIKYSVPPGHAEIKSFQIPSATTITKVNTIQDDNAQRKGNPVPPQQQQQASLVLTSPGSAIRSSSPGMGPGKAYITPAASTMSMTRQQQQQHHAQTELFHKTAEGLIRVLPKEEHVPGSKGHDPAQPPRVDINVSMAHAAAAANSKGRLPMHDQYPSIPVRLSQYALGHSGEVRILSTPVSTSSNEHVIMGREEREHPRYSPPTSMHLARPPGIQEKPEFMKQINVGVPHDRSRALPGMPPQPMVGHLPNPHTIDQRNSDSPIISSLYKTHIYQPASPAHQGMPRETYKVMYSDASDRPQHAGSPSFAPGQLERDRIVSSPYAPREGNSLTRSYSPPPAHGRYSVPPNQDLALIERPRMGTQSPSSLVGPSLSQGDSLLLLLQRYPIMWQGLLALKNDSAACQMHFVSGNMNVARDSLPSNPDGSVPPLRISQRMRLEPTQLDGVARKMQMDAEHCMLLALPCGRDHRDVLQQSNNLRSGFITYLQLKQAAGIVNTCHPVNNQPAYVIHIFPSCDFANENLARIAPDLLHGVADIAHLLIVIATV